MAVPPAVFLLHLESWARPGRRQESLVGPAAATQQLSLRLRGTCGRALQSTDTWLAPQGCWLQCPGHSLA